MTDTPQPPRGVDVPDNIYVECPLIGKRLRRVLDCRPCEHYRGLGERFADEKMPFRARYVVACAFPFSRGLFEVE